MVVKLFKIPAPSLSETCALLPCEPRLEKRSAGSWYDVPNPPYRRAMLAFWVRGAISKVNASHSRRRPRAATQSCQQA